MEGPEGSLMKEKNITEGKVKLSVTLSGGGKGPGTKGGVFYNPAMVQNRDLSILIMQYLLENDLLPGKNKRVLDGLCGSGARALRLSKETDLIESKVSVIATDINPSSIEISQKNAEFNGITVEFCNEDLNSHLIKNRYSYVDIDPFGSPVPFIQSAVQGVLKGGYIGVTATDTAALTGSIPRVARRRYGIKSFMTHAYQEVACRSMMGYVARSAASFERSADPVLFYISDHFVRGYIRIEKGARKSDSSLENVGWINYTRPGPPSDDPPCIPFSKEKGKGVLGPIWTGPLEDPVICKGLKGLLEKQKWSYLASKRSLSTLLERAIAESGFPMMGYDINILSSHLKISPPSLDTVVNGLEKKGRGCSRSRFSPTIFKTDAEWDEVVGLFRGG